MSASPSPADSAVPSRFVHPEFFRENGRVRLAFGGALLAIGLILVPVEWTLWDFILAQPQPLVAWMANFNRDTSPYFLWLLLLPAAWLCRRHLIDPDGVSARVVEGWLQAGRLRQSLPATTTGTCEAEQPLVFRLVGRSLPLLCGLLGGLNALWIQHQFGDLPPAYHDEYSYLFQAETFLSGRVTAPRFEAAPELFDQMHVLNDQPGRFASRYFPGTGLWLVPFVALGVPYLGYAVAQGLFCGLLCQLARDLSGNGVALLTGVLTALLPGLGLFSSLLLAHHPGLVGLGLFLVMFHRWLFTGFGWQALLAGVGLSAAMLCRPMTAAGLALPHGIYFVWLLLRRKNLATNGPGWHVTDWSSRIWGVALLGGPILLTLLALLPYHAAITGSPWVSPYQQYTQLRTPRHVYGFHNRSRGEVWIAEQQAAGVELPIVEKYDEWARELTIPGSLENVKQRALASGMWTLGILPALAGVICFLIIGQRDRPDWWLLGGSLLALHLVHIPYWYEGIMHWHYVFETGPLLVLMFARSTQLLAWNFRRQNRHWLTIWWLGLPALGLMLAYTSCEPLWRGTVADGVSELKFAREQHAEFTDWVESQVETPAVVFIREDPADVHLDFVVNSPFLDAPVLRAHWRPARYSTAQLQALFPDRHLYLADLVNKTFTPLP